MNHYTVADLVAITHGQLLAGDGAVMAAGISTDSRTLRAGEAFLAIRGARFDGHAFVEAAVDRGASALIVERGSRPAADAGRSGCPVIAVEDGIRALGAVARHHRRQFTGPVVAITGSCGKTTTKEGLARILEARGPVAASQGTQNNQIGVPLTLLALKPEHQAAVVELGSNHPGEIAYLASLVSPTHLIITCIGPSHLEFFGTVETVAAEKWSAANHLRPGGTVFLPGDEPLLQRLWQARRTEQPTALRLITFGLSALCDVTADEVSSDGARQRFRLRSPWLPPSAASRRVEIGLPGRHNVENALAAAACAAELGCSFEQLASGLARWQAAPRRLERLEVGGVILLNDCYNANPRSAAAALETLAHWPAAGRRIFVCGDMLELGPETAQWHRRLGHAAAQQGIDVVVAVGAFARETVTGCRLGHDHQGLVKACRTLEEAADFLYGVVAPGDCVLIKGSRLCRLEQLTQRLQERLAPAQPALMGA